MPTEEPDDYYALPYFMRVADEACAEAYAAWAAPMKHVEAIDELYIDSIPLLGQASSSTCTVLLMNAHASFRAAIRLSLSGQLLPMFMTLRGSLESALYANAITVDPSLERVWLDRDDGPEAKAECRNKFGIKRVLGFVAKAHNQNFADTVSECYDLSIDFGAHPNSRSLMSTVHIEELDTSARELNFGYILNHKSSPARQSLIACAETGLLTFYVTLLSLRDVVGVVSLKTRAKSLESKIAEIVTGLGFPAPVSRTPWGFD